MLDVDATVEVLTGEVALVGLVELLEAALEHGSLLVRAELREFLRRLADVMGCVGIVSGRPLYFLLDSVPVPGLAYGGCTDSSCARRQAWSIRRCCRSSRRSPKRRKPRRPRSGTGVGVERKAGICLTLHYRRCEARRRGERVLGGARRSAGLDCAGPAWPSNCGRRAGRQGTAVDALIDGMAVGAFAGDDRATSRIRRAGAVDDERLVRRPYRCRLARSAARARGRGRHVVDGPDGLLHCWRPCWRTR